MSKKSLYKAIGVGSLIFASSLLFTNCKNILSEQQLAQIKELRKNEKALQDDVQAKKKEKAGLEIELNKRMGELKDCKDHYNLIKGRLDQFPNLNWSDGWKPEPEKKAEPDTE
jgi:hypothetical protein